MSLSWRRKLLGLMALVGAAVAVVVLVVLSIAFLQRERIRQVAASGIEDSIAKRAAILVLEHVRVIDGKGRPPVEDQRIIIAGGKIAFVGGPGAGPLPAGSTVLELPGRTVFPGLVGMHEHLFTDSETESPDHPLAEQGTIFPRMYLSAGVTTARTAGSIDPEADLRVKARIDSGEMPGPNLFLTAPYLEGQPPTLPEMVGLKDATEARERVATWASRGMTSFKAYMNITADELRAAVVEAHARGLKITGHLCTIGFTEAADLGIDNLEHGLLADTEFFSGKQQGVCPPPSYLKEYASRLDVASPRVEALIRHLVERHVAITSTLAVFESELGAPPERDAARVRDVLTWRAWRSAHDRAAYVAQFHVSSLLGKEMEFERAYVQAGGTLLAGADPTGDGNTLAGFGDQRELELLVQAGFTPVEALRIATENGAEFLGIADRTGSIETGKQADLVVVTGDPSRDISSVRKVELVFKEGVGYSPERLLAGIHGVVGIPN